MNREFLWFYNQELAILREQAAEFAEDYPGIAEQLGGLVGDNADPMITGLLEGAAFLAARVQLKLKHEFADFTTNLIDQLAPHYLAPTPSFVLVQARHKFGDPSLRDGRPIARGACVRGDISRGASQRRVPVHACGAGHALALRHRQGGVSDELGSISGSRSQCGPAVPQAYGSSLPCEARCEWKRRPRIRRRRPGPSCDFLLTA